VSAPDPQPILCDVIDGEQASTADAAT